jgi:hypothetical protein
VSEEQWGYLVWGLLAAVVAFPEILAGVGRELVPFPGFDRTVIYLQARRPLLTMILLGLFAVLIVHIIWYPWPDRP